MYMYKHTLFYEIFVHLYDNALKWQTDSKLNHSAFNDVE